MRKFPLNFILLGGFTATEGFLVGVVCATYTVDSVLAAVVACAILVGALSLYAMTTKSDFTGMGPYLFAALLALMLFGLICMFLPSPFMQKVYAGCGLLLFSFYLIMDTQQIMGKGQLAI